MPLPLDTPAHLTQPPGAINRAKSSAYPPPPVYAPPRGRGGLGRGRGRGGRGGAYPSAPPTTNRNASWVAPKVPGGEPTVVVNPIPFVARPAPGVPLVAGRGGFKNRTLVLKDGKPVLPAANGVASSSSAAAASVAPTVIKNAAGEVVIDGVTFISDPRGNKLVRKPGKWSSLPASHALLTSSCRLHQPQYLRSPVRPVYAEAHFCIGHDLRPHQVGQPRLARLCQEAQGARGQEGAGGEEGSP